MKNVQVQKCELITNDDKKHDKCYDDATAPTPDRKLKEMRLAIGVEKNFSKDDILRGYLNITGFGGTVYGIEAAASYYYNGATAASLTLAQAASLIAIVNNPVKFQLDKPDSETNGAANGYAANKDRRDYILDEMLKYKKVTQEEYDAAIAAPIEPVIKEPSTGCATALDNAFFCDYVLHILQNDETFGPDEDTRMLNFRRGGFDVYTTLDLDLQGAAVATMNENVPKVLDFWDVGAVISSVQVGTGRVLAMTQNKDYSQDPEIQQTGANVTGINYNTDHKDGGSNGFQPGSTYKVFTLAEWLKEGHSLNERVDSRRKSNWGTFQDSCDGPQVYPGWDPKNDANEAGTNYSALQSTIGSINTGFIGMAKKLDLCGIRNTAEAFGVHRADGGPLLKSASTVLGTNEIAPLTMAAAFAGIANGGLTCTPIAIDKIIGPGGTEQPVPASDCVQSVDPAVAAGMAYGMTRVMSGGTGASSNDRTEPWVPMIGKTGTTDDNMDTWMTGSSTKVATVAGVMTLRGGPNGHANQRSISFDSGDADTARHRMWPAVMSVANAKYGGDEFAEASSNVIQAAQVPIPDLRGQSMTDAQAILEDAGFEFTDGGPIDSELPVGTVAGSDPAGGTSAGRGSTITVYSSNGAVVLLPNVVGMTEAEARAALASYDVRKKENDISNPGDEGRVISMEPSAGSPSKPGGQVTLVLGK